MYFKLSTRTLPLQFMQEQSMEKDATPTVYNTQLLAANPVKDIAESVAIVQLVVSVILLKSSE